ncbi:unnamed protein product [Vitrella brassicaformis CCMP3155]|uniref:Uncharacterized protein n=1 Tax=Vitrella brassicaformis (strain CCMP3155) TaxID=1169540 RepID=A0A0G4EH08_VITBC|nr:unnamed protein product [Vitrella brassicaformis CCMP3155]|eukprot:CEL95754.1 unnamed protein product [Vitrella brassicaformis CCMP3155]
MLPFGGPLPAANPHGHVGHDGVSGFDPRQSGDQEVGQRGNPHPLTGGGFVGPSSLHSKGSFCSSTMSVTSLIHPQMTPQYAQAGAHATDPQAAAGHLSPPLDAFSPATDVTLVRRKHKPFTPQCDDEHLNRFPPVVCVP